MPVEPVVEGAAKTDAARSSCIQHKNIPGIAFRKVFIVPVPRAVISGYFFDLRHALFQAPDVSQGVRQPVQGRLFAQPLLMGPRRSSGPEIVGRRVFGNTGPPDKNRIVADMDMSRRACLTGQVTWCPTVTLPESRSAQQ